MQQVLSGAICFSSKYSRDRLEGLLPRAELHGLKVKVHPYLEGEKRATREELAIHPHHLLQVCSLLHSLHQSFKLIVEHTQPRLF